MGLPRSKSHKVTLLFTYARSELSFRRTASAAGGLSNGGRKKRARLNCSPFSAGQSTALGVDKRERARTWPTLSADKNY